jgi:hypothetical protein
MSPQCRQDDIEIQAVIAYRLEHHTNDFAVN